MEEFILIKPSEEYASQIAEYRQDFINADSSMDGTGFLRRMAEPMEYIKSCREFENPETVPQGLVQATQFMYLRKSDKRVVGMIQIRHYFNEHLEKYGGHIGYSVRPSEQRKGYAKAMLKAVLPFCREIGLERVLITCKEANTASEKTILANGGVYECTVYEPDAKTNMKRFWIEL